MLRIVDPEVTSAMKSGISLFNKQDNFNERQVIDL